MSKKIIIAEDISKIYKLNHEGTEKYTALRDVISRKAKNFLNKKERVSYSEDFWALKNISFEINQGDRLGIIGRNGAGKSTLLKILSRISEPSKGKITIKGRVASLLEVGTGFHPELTGRENIYLNGAILGMSRNEIKFKFDEIVDFAEVEKFLDTPVKRYSSGMYVRLAFAVAAHLEPEILIVDEVLAVGDAQFQKKCLGKMDDVSKNDGRTVLFVSHNLGAVSSLCNRGIYLSKGELVFDGTITETIKQYSESDSSVQSLMIYDLNKRPGNEIVKLNSVQVVNQYLENKTDFNINEKIGLCMDYEVFLLNKVLWFGFNIYNSEGVNIFDTHSVDLELYNKVHPLGRHKAVVWIPENLLSNGFHSVSCAIFNHNDNVVYLHEKSIISFNVIDMYGNNTSRGDSRGDFPGIIRPYLKWENYGEY